eukprot:82471-Chlamydomonas_euryale.AAC.6
MPLLAVLIPPSCLHMHLTDEAPHRQVVDVHLEVPVFSDGLRTCRSGAHAAWGEKHHDSSSWGRSHSSISSQAVSCHSCSWGWTASCQCPSSMGRTGDMLDRQARQVPAPGSASGDPCPSRMHRRTILLTHLPERLQLSRAEALLADGFLVAHNHVGDVVRRAGHPIRVHDLPQV